MPPSASSMFDVRDKPDMVERALLVGVYFNRNDHDEAASLLEELADLVDTLGIGIGGTELVKAVKSHTRYLMGTGKTQEVIDEAHQLGCDCIIFDNSLSPMQQRAWEGDSNLCVIDREEVILDIFAMRASTKEARLQVDLARMQYSLPRLARMWAHLDRQGGGAGGGKGGGAAARGEGEKQVEIDRRLAREKISRLKSEIEQVRKQRSTQRKERVRVPLPHAAIVGYTNAGKSSLLNQLTGAEVLAEDKLFATLDTTTRKLELPDGQPLLLTDTVGFVRNLPHRLVEAFKATLEEAVLADFLVHVLDASAPKIAEFHKTTLEVLAELGADEKRLVTVLNKVDLISPEVRRDLGATFPDAVFISVKTGEGLEALHHRLSEMLADRVASVSARIPQARADIISLLHREGKVISTEYEGQDILVKTVIPRRLLSVLEPFRTK